MAKSDGPHAKAIHCFSTHENDIAALLASCAS